MTTTETPKAETPKPKAPAKKRTPRNIAVKPKPKAKVAAAPKEPQVNPHIAAGVSLARYKGPSSYVNSNRSVKVMLGVRLAPSKLTSRSQGGLYALRDSYKDQPFLPKGFDNGILRNLTAAGLISLTGGQKSTIDGKDYMVDGDKPVKAKITAAGMAYGKA